MYPVICSIGPVQLYSYGLMLGVAFLLAMHLASKRAHLFNIKEDFITNLGICFLIAGVVGARALFVVLNLDYFLENPLQVLFIHKGGLVYYGGFVLACFAGIVYGRRHKVSVLDGADLVVPFLALAHSIGRLGCFLNGCCYGKPTESFIGIVFPHTHIKVYPTQLLSALGLLIIFTLLFLIQKKRKFKGQVLALYLIIYGGFRFSIEFLRGDLFGVFYNFTVTQLISILLIISGSILYIRLMKNR